MAFDMQRLQNDMSRELENDISRLNGEYQKHKQAVNDRFRKCEDMNRSSQQLKSDSVSMRTQKQRALHEISSQNKQFEAKYAQENNQKADLRLRMVEMEKRLRELQREIATTNLENETLKSLLGGE